jgi:hypothetical protein
VITNEVWEKKMIILERVVKLPDLVANTKSETARLRRTRQPEFLAANGKTDLVVISTKTFFKLKEDLESAELHNQLYEIRLEEFRTGKISAEQLRSELRPNPRAVGTPAKEAFAMLRHRIRARKKKMKL